MCYTIYLSTTSERDLGELNSVHCRFDKVVGEEDQEIIDLLAHPHHWNLNVYGASGCSCHFRHLASREYEPLFEEPQEWSPEDPDEVESTKRAYDHFKAIVEAGHQLDIVDVWTDTSAEDVVDIEVSLSKVGRDAFRFIEAGRLVVLL